MIWWTWLSVTLCSAGGALVSVCSSSLLYLAVCTLPTLRCNSFGLSNWEQPIHAYEHKNNDGASDIKEGLFASRLSNELNKLNPKGWVVDATIATTRRV
jgi:hypothetical protein